MDTFRQHSNKPRETFKKKHLKGKAVILKWSNLNNIIMSDYIQEHLKSNAGEASVWLDLKEKKSHRQ